MIEVETICGWAVYVNGVEGASGEWLPGESRHLPEREAERILTNPWFRVKEQTPVVQPAVEESEVE